MVAAAARGWQRAPMVVGAERWTLRAAWCPGCFLPAGQWDVDLASKYLVQ